MTTHSPDFTPRYKLDYSAWGFQHSSIFRLNRGQTWNLLNSLTMQASLTSYLAQLVTILADDYAIIGASVADQDSSVFNPTGYTPTLPVGTIPATTLTPKQRINASTFSGRGGGAPYHVEQYGLYWRTELTLHPEAGNGKVDASESTVVLNAIAALNAANLSSAAGSGVVIFKPYITVKENDYWLKRVRKTFP